MLTHFLDLLAVIYLFYYDVLKTNKYICFLA